MPRALYLNPCHRAPVFRAWIAVPGCLQANPAVPGPLGSIETTPSAHPAFHSPQVSQTGKLKPSVRQGLAQTLSAGCEKPREVLL